MIKKIATIAVMACALSAGAQKKTEYFANGNKKFEGNYRWAWNWFDGRDHVNFESTDKRKATALRGAEQNAHTDALPAKLYDGKCTFYYENGKIANTGRYEDGVKDGMFVYYYSDGSKQAECGYKAGMPDGEWKKWMPDGKPASVMNYKALTDAELDTIWTRRVYDQFTYTPFRKRYNGPEAEPDSLRGLQRYWYNVRRDAEAMINKSAHWHGAQTVYYDNGQPAVEMYFDNDVRSGTWRYKDPQGRVQVELVFTNGKITGGYNELKEDVGRRSLEGRDALWAEMIRAEGSTPQATGIDPGTGPAAGVAPAPVPTADRVFTYVEQMPVSSYDLNEYLAKSIHYPETAKRNQVEGRVIVKFIVNEDGSIGDVQVVRSIGAGCDDEAVRVIKAMPAWKPGKQNGQAVKVYYTLPVMFKL